MINIDHISFEYTDGHKALSDIALNIESGSITAIVGANGAGKSTLLSLLAGIQTVKEGKIEIDGTVLNKENMETIRRKVGYIFQNPDDQLFMPRVYDDIAFGPRNFGYKRSEVETMVSNAMELLHVGDLKDRTPHRMSGGEKRCVAMAAVLAMNPQILLLDEPTSFLDPRSRRNVINILGKLNHTIVIATHDLDMVLDICNRVIVLQHGRIIADGIPDEILVDAAFMENSGMEIPLSLQNKDFGRR